MANIRSDIIELSEKTGYSIDMCREAIEYAEAHEGTTATGYLKARTLAINITGMNFDERVSYFSKLGKNNTQGLA